MFLYLEKDSINFTCTFSKILKSLLKIIKYLELKKGVKKVFQSKILKLKFCYLMIKNKSNLATNSFLYSNKKYKYKNKRNKFK
jgi:Fic family protein